MVQIGVIVIVVSFIFGLLTVRAPAKPTSAEDFMFAAAKAIIVACTTIIGMFLIVIDLFVRR